MTTTADGLIIRTATEQDWPNIIVLNEICFGTPQKPEFFEYWKALNWAPTAPSSRSTGTPWWARAWIFR